MIDMTKLIAIAPQWVECIRGPRCAPCASGSQACAE
jgi:hypothetical protein